MNTSNNAIPLLSFVFANFGGANPQSGHVINGSADKLAYSFIAHDTSEISAVNVFLRGVGAPNAKLIISIQSDNGSNAPDGIPLGAATAAIDFAPGAAYTWTGEISLGMNTGALTVNNKYWIVIEVQADPAPTLLDGGNYYQSCSRTSGIAYVPDGNNIGYYDGVSWTMIARQATFILKYTTVGYTGLPIPYDTTSLATNKIWCDSDSAVDWRQGIKYRLGISHQCIGIRCIIDRVGSPVEGLIFDLFEGSTLKQSTIEIESAQVANVDLTPAFFPFVSPVILKPNTDIYIIGRQATSTGGDAANSYDILTYDLSDVDYHQCLSDPDMNFSFVHGSGADPTGFTAETLRYMPLLVPCVSSPIDDLIGLNGQIFIDGAWRNIV